MLIGLWGYISCLVSFEGKDPGIPKNLLVSPRACDWDSWRWWPVYRGRCHPEPDLSHQGQSSASSVCLLVQGWTGGVARLSHIPWIWNDSCLQTISYSSPRGGVSQITEKGETTSSFLLVQKATLSDSGKYKCHPAVGNKAEVTVHVIRGRWCILKYGSYL